MKKMFTVFVLFLQKNSTFIRDYKRIKLLEHMKKHLLLFGMLALSANLGATDTLSVHAPQIPLLTNQRDNVLFEIRLDADKGDVLNELALEFGESPFSLWSALVWHRLARDGGSRSARWVNKYLVD